jgi:hypothetical protein
MSKIESLPDLLPAHAADRRHWADSAMFVRRAALELDHLRQPDELADLVKELLESAAKLIDRIPIDRYEDD